MEWISGNVFICPMRGREGLWPDLGCTRWMIAARLRRCWAAGSGHQREPMDYHV